MNNALFPRDIFSMFFDFTEPLTGTKLNISGPKMDMYEEDNTLVIRLQVPGFKEDEINININDNTLRITGQKKQQKEQKERRYFVQEITSQAFSRVISLPYPVDQSKAEAYFEDGYLVIRLPKLVKTNKGLNIIPIKRKK